MDWLDIIKTLGIIGVPIAIAITGYVVGAMKSLDAANKANAKNISEFKLEVAKDYVPRKEMAETLLMLRSEWKELEQRFDKRIDRMEVWMGRRFDELLGRPTPPKKD